MNRMNVNMPTEDPMSNNWPRHAARSITLRVVFWVAFTCALRAPAADAATWWFNPTTLTTTASGTGYLWSTLTNWNSLANASGTAAGAVPGASDDVVFNVTGSNSVSGNYSLGAARSVNSLTVNTSGASSITKNSGTSTGTFDLSIGSGGITLGPDAGSVYFSFNTAPLAAQRIAVRASASSLPITNNSSSLLSFQSVVDSVVGSGASTINVATNGVGGITFLGGLANTSTSTIALVINSIGSGTTTIAGVPNASLFYSGGTTLTAGNLAATANGSLGSGTVSINGGTLLTSGSQAVSSVRLTSGTVYVNDSNSRSLGAGLLTINGGNIVSLNNARVLPNAVTVGGDFKLGGGGSTLTLSGAVNLGGAIRTVTLGNNATFTNTISSGGLIVASSSSGVTMTMSGSSSYANGTTLNDSFANNTLAVGHINALGTGPLTVNAGSLNLGTTGVSVGLLSGSAVATITTTTNAIVALTTTAATDSTFAGVISNGSGTVAFAKAGAGTLTLAGANGYAGGTTITGGGITAANPSALGTGSVTLSANTTLGVTSGTLSIGDFSTAGAATISLAAITNGIASIGGVNFNDFANTITVGGSPLAGTSTLVSGVSLAGTSGLTLTGAAVGNSTIALNGSQTVGRNTYQFTSAGNSLQLVTTANVLSLTWDPAVPSGSWNTTATNWLVGGTGSGVAFTDGDNVTFHSAATVSVPSSVDPGTMSITNATGTVDISGAGLITASTLSKSAAGAATISANVTVASGVSVSGGSLAIGGALGVTNGGLNVSGGLATLNAASTIAGGITVTGGTTAVNVANTISGAVAVSNGGVLSLGDTGGAGSGSISLDNGTLASTLASGTLANAISVGSGGGTLSGFNPLTLTGAITGAGSLMKTGAGEFVVAGSLGTISGPMSVSVAAGSSLRLTGTTVKYLSGTVNPGVNDGTLTFDNVSITTMGGTIAAGAGTIVVSGSSSLTGLTNTGFATIETPISGAGSLTIDATTLNRSILSGSNSYSGGTFLNRNVGITNGSALGSGPITLIALSTQVSRITNDGLTALTLANAVNTGATSLALAGSNAIALTGTITGTGNIRAATGIADLTQQSAATMLNTGTVEMNSGGQVWVSSASNLGSNTSILFSGSVPSTLVAKGDTGVITQNVYLGSLTGVTASVDTGGYTVTLGGTLADLTSAASSVFEKSGAGTLILSANNTYARDTTVSAGTMLVNGGLYNGAAAGTTTVAAGAILGGSGSIARAVNVNGTLKGHGTQFTGPVTILGGTHSPGNSPGSQTFTNGLTYSGSSTLEWELIANGTTGAGTTFDFIALTGGTMTIGTGAAMQLMFNSGGSTVNWNDPIWNASSSWTVIDATGALSSSGNFSLLGNPSTWVDSNSLSLASAMAPNNRTTSTFTVDNSTGSIVLNYSAILVPEPAAIGLVALGTFGLVLVRRRKRSSHPGLTPSPARDTRPCGCPP